MQFVALTATVTASTPGAALGIDLGLPPPGLASGAVRFEPLAGDSDGITVAGAGTYRGVIEVRRNGAGLAVVDDLGLEDYVRGIDEVPPSWPAAALQAQAIAARTYAAHRAITGDNRWQAVGADICATSICQVYRGLDAERRAKGYGWLAAVEATAGRALLSGGQPILASYSSTANGPRAMSQNGALEMANAGRSATEILQSYYGVGPSAAAGRLPATIRVAVAMKMAAVGVSGRFRVTDAGGVELASSEAGEWRIVPAGAGFSLVPPDSYRPAPAPAVTTEPVAPRQPGRAILAGTQPARAPRSPLVLAAGVLVLAGGAVAARARADARLLRLLCRLAYPRGT